MSQNWNKTYSRINWQNRPSSSTALGATNLNKEDSAINEIDNRVITLDTLKADMSEVNNMVSDVSVDVSTGIITVSYKNGSTKTYDTKLEKIAVNFEYDEEEKELVITLDDGTKQYIDLSTFITVFEFTDSSTIAFSVNNSNVSAIVKNGSITSEKLQPNYLADITEQATEAGASAQSAEDASVLAQSYAIGGTNTRQGEDTDNAKYYMERAEEYAEGAVAGGVLGIKGSNEMYYQHGNVVLYPESLGTVSFFETQSYPDDNKMIACSNMGAVYSYGNTSDCYTYFSTHDHESEEDGWKAMEHFGTTPDNNSTLFSKISKVFHNLRFLYKLLGTTDISQIGSGTVTSAINSINANLLNKNKINVKAWLPSNGYDPHAHMNDYYLQSYGVNPNLMVAQGAPDGFSEYASVVLFGSAYPTYIYVDVFGNMAVWSDNKNGWVAH